MMGLQVFFQEVGSIAFSGGVTDEDDLIRRSDIFRHLLIKRILFGHALATVVRFLSMNQMMMEIERIVRPHRCVRLPDDFHRGLGKRGRRGGR